MIHITYDQNSTIAFNDGAIQKIAEKIVTEHGSTEEIHYLTVGQELFISAIRSFMRQHDVDYRNLTVDVVIDENNTQRLMLTDYYRFNDYTNLPDLISDILMPLL